MRVFDILKRNPGHLEHFIVRVIAVAPDMLEVAKQVYAERIRDGSVILELDKSLLKGTIIDRWQFMKRGSVKRPEVGQVKVVV